MSRRPEDLIDEIDQLVDESLERGDQSQSFYGERMPSCPWCPEQWHFLPITETMRQMRRGSYATDEFGYGIVDPEYSYQDDQSAVLCPGSEFVGPRDKYGTWDKQSRERAKERPHVTRSDHIPQIITPDLPPGPLRRLRFVGPLDPWTISINDDRVIEGTRVVGPQVVRQVLTASFERDMPFRNPSREWLERNVDDIVDRNLIVREQGTMVFMKPVVIPFSRFEVYGANPEVMPDWIEFTTSYRIEGHSWFWDLWSISGTEEDIVLTPISQPSPYVDRPEGSIQGHEADYAIIDEAYEHRDEELAEYVNQVQATARSLAETTRIPPGYLTGWTTAEEDR